MRHLIIAAFCLFSIAAEPAARPGWKLVWADEFDKDGAPDPAHWTFEHGHVRNNEMQYYTDDRRENARVEHGCLIIEARKDSLALRGGKTAAVTSAALETRDRASWRYGRIEVRAKVPQGRGTWPAIWMMPQDMSAGWPACGEIDLMESVGYEPDLVHQTIHTKAANHINHKQRSTVTPIKNLDADFHVYAMEWDAKTMTMYVDGKQSFKFENTGDGPDVWPFDKPFCMILNLAIGGSWGGLKGVDESIFPCRMEVDYVRAYRAE